MKVPVDGHEPVLPGPVLELLRPFENGVVVDCTVGRGGHSGLFLGVLGAGGMLIGLDADERNLVFAEPGLKLAGRAGRVRLFHANFSTIGEVLEQAGISGVSVIFADLGVSTNQLFEAEYGMSFSAEMPLDMRLDERLTLSAADLVNRLPEEELANLIFENAQERFSRRIARKIAAERRIAPIANNTARLADIVRSAIPKKPGPQRIDPATRTFMALRMRVNRELESLEKLLNDGPGLLAPGGRMGIISFHSMEDRLVKNRFRELSGMPGYRLVTRKAVEPDEAETQRNPRARSAKFRVIERLATNG